MNVNFKIEEEQSNVRSNQVSFKVIIENSSVEKIELQSLTPQVPEGVFIEEKQDTFKESNLQRFDNLCLDLTRLLDNHLKIQSEDLLDNLARVRSELTKKFLLSLPMLFRVYLIMLIRSKKHEFLREVSVAYSTYKYRIRTYSDGCWAYDKYFKNDQDSIIKGFYEGKLKQLEELSTSIDSSNSLVIAHIEPNSFYSRNYIIKCKRNIISQKMFTFSIDSQFVGDDKEKIQRMTASSSITISPYPLMLSLIAMISGLFGVILKSSIKDFKVTNIETYFHDLGVSLVTGPGLSAILVSLVFFNILEYTDIGKKIKMGINWRSALLIGIISGLMCERLIEALKVFVGLS